MSPTTSRRAVSRAARCVIAAVAMFAAVPARAISDEECSAMHKLVDHTFVNFDRLIGSPFKRDPGNATIFKLSSPAHPFENCQILEFEKSSLTRVLECDLTAQVGIEPIAAKQTEMSAAVFVKTIQSVADDYSKCFYQRPIGPKEEAARDQRVKTTWLWPLTLDAFPSQGAYVVLDVRQARTGVEIGTPSIKVQFARYERGSRSEPR